jgi:hypothetical protein
MPTGWYCLRRGTNGRVQWTWWWNCGYLLQDRRIKDQCSRNTQQHQFMTEEERNENKLICWLGYLNSPGKRFFISLKPASDYTFPSCRRPAVQRALINYTLLKIRPFYLISWIFFFCHSIIVLIYLISFFFFYLFPVFSFCPLLVVVISSSSFVPLSWVLYLYFCCSRNEKLQSAPICLAILFSLSVITASQHLIQFDCVKLNSSLSGI